MLKKITIAIIAILYLGVSSGIAMEIHYCMGKKSGIDFYSDKDGQCGKCGMKDKKGCCSDEHKFYKLNDAHKNISNDIAFTSPEAILVPTGIPLNCLDGVEIQPANTLKNNSPPDYTGPEACILYCVFRI